MQDIIQLQRATIAAHIQAENIKDWFAVYDTFIQKEEAYYDVAPFATRFQGFSGVKDFYQVFTVAVPDFQVLVTGEQDARYDTLREVTITRTYQGEYCGVPAWITINVSGIASTKVREH